MQMEGPEEAGSMSKPDWRHLNLDPGVLREPTPDETRLVLWLPGEFGTGTRDWERVSNVPGTAVTREQGLCAVPATSLRARQRVQGCLGKFWQRFRKPGGSQSWVLPNGASAEQVGERQAGLLLVWAENGTQVLDKAHVKARWPAAQRCQPIGSNLFLLSGLEPVAAPGAAEPFPTEANPGDQAAHLLTAARQAGDRPAEVSALTDLGIAWMRGGQPRRAVELLEEALALARQLGDGSGECDVLTNLGLPVLAIGQPRRALEILEQALALARAAGNRFGEKIALEKLGMLYAALHDNTQALAHYDQALALARQVGDRKHEAELLWDLAIENAELGQREQAIRLAQCSIEIFQDLGNPHTGWLANHVEKYRQGGMAASFPQTPPSVLGPGAEVANYGGSIVVSTGPSPAAADQAATGPGLLRMAISAVKSMAKFLGSGFKTAGAATYRRRLDTCATCEHHTGVRCKVCGCFTSVKAWMAHEKCPLGKWPL